MVRPKLALICLLALALYLFPHASTARSINKHCGVTSCGNLSVSYPFRLKSQPQGCGFMWFELVCNNNRTIFPTEDGDFYVQNISYVNKTIHLLDVNVANHNCSIPLSSLPLSPIDNSTFQNDFAVYVYSYSEYSKIYVVNCSMKMNKSWHGVNYINASRCSSSPQTNNNFYYFVDGGTPPSDFNPSCTVEARVPISLHNISGLSTVDIYKKLMMGTRIKWDLRLLNIVILDWSSVVNILLSFLRVWALVALYILSNAYRILLGKPIIVFQIPFLAITGTQIWMLLMRTFLGICCLIALVIYKLRRRHLSVDDAIENFLQSQINFMPIRYSYAELKKITGDFKDKLGDGVKLLKESKGNGQDFINEVATIGRIHHVNVVELVGFCVEWKKQALVYDFMKNGSLDKFIFSTNSSLSWQKMFEIAVGVGRGIQYLHNDEKFNPKLSDFGLAKLHSVDDSIISLTAARGTLGYMAPELFYKNLGGISYKADVYSFGMMLMEIVGRRKNLNAFVDNSSKIYFPSWIYHLFELGENIELENMTENVNKIVRKMIIVAFWCIQTKPVHRPTMTKVLKMLESEEELLEIPPKSFLFSVDVSSNDNDY
ncbi:hypothetical protein ES332_D01G050300v1 [Gossypium tomentosum]|uniref:Protein kinase domain-containing protein n=1 Tax=Gossypium tomentosum TaxID=34277 RepID=A0A5D2M5E1_GOSTO|nr:hypothetical protein ES332_D01G050300v1 [Gossypium tomentosum]